MDIREVKGLSGCTKQDNRECSDFSCDLGSVSGSDSDVSAKSHLIHYNQKMNEQSLSNNRIFKALTYLSKLHLGDFNEGNCLYKNPMQFAKVMHELGRCNISYKQWGYIMKEARLDEKVNIALKVRDIAIKEGKLEYARDLNTMAYQIIVSLKSSVYDLSVLQDIKKKMDIPAAEASKESGKEQNTEFESRLSCLCEVVAELPVSIKKNHTFALKTAETYEQYQQTQAQILGTLTSRNKTDHELALRKLYHFISGLPSQETLMFNLVHIPQTESFILDIVNSEVKPIASFLDIDISTLIMSYESMHKKNEERSFLKCWELYAKGWLVISIKYMSEPEPDFETCIRYFEKIGNICESCYELVKMDVALNQPLIKRESDKRKKIVKKFKDDIPKFRKTLIEVGLVSMFYLFVTYYKKKVHELGSEKLLELSTSFNLHLCMLESFASLADLDNVFYNIPQVENSLAFGKQVLSIIKSFHVSSTPDQLRAATEVYSYTKLNELFLEKMISHYIISISHSCIDDPKVPKIMEQILYGLVMHGGYNVVTIWVVKYLRDLAYLRNSIALVCWDDGNKFFSNDFIDSQMKIKEINLLVDKIYNYRQVFNNNDILTFDDGVNYLLPQVLLDCDNQLVILPEFKTVIKEGSLYRIGMEESCGILRLNRDAVNMCNHRSMLFLQAIFESVEIPLLEELFRYTQHLITLECLYDGPHRFC